MDIGVGVDKRLELCRKYYTKLVDRLGVNYCPKDTLLPDDITFVMESMPMKSANYASA